MLGFSGLGFRVDVGGLPACLVSYSVGRSVRICGATYCPVPDSRVLSFLSRFPSVPLGVRS